MLKCVYTCSYVYMWVYVYSCVHISQSVTKKSSLGGDSLRHSIPLSHNERNKVSTPFIWTSKIHWMGHCVSVIHRSGSGFRNRVTKVSGVCDLRVPDCYYWGWSLKSQIRHDPWNVHYRVSKTICRYPIYH